MIAKPLTNTVKETPDVGDVLKYRSDLLGVIEICVNDPTVSLQSHLPCFEAGSRRRIII